MINYITAILQQQQQVLTRIELPVFVADFNYCRTIHPIAASDKLCYSPKSPKASVGLVILYCNDIAYS